jgi:zinc protease
LLAPLAAAEDSLDTKAGRAFRHALFGEHPYARMLNTADVDKLSHSDVDTWIGRVHNLRNAALVVVGDVNPEDVERGATLLSSRAPGWVAELPTPAPPAIRAASAEHVTPVISDRPGSLMEIRVGCLLPQMTLADRGHYELLRSAIDARLNTALRVEQGDGYGVNVGYERLRGGTTYLAISTFVDGQQLADSLGVLRRHWQRWAHAGFEASELNVARWLYAEALPIASGNGNALAFELLRAWNVEPKGPTGDGLRPDIGGLRAERVNELFAACKANTVLGLTGNEVVIRKALEDAWPGLGSRARAVAP